MRDVLKATWAGKYGGSGAGTAIVAGSGAAVASPATADSSAASSYAVGGGAGSGGRVTASSVDPPPAAGPTVPTTREAREPSALAPSLTPRPSVPPSTGAIEVTTSDGRVIKLDGEYEEISGETEIITRKVKENDKVIVPKFPSVTNIRQWQNGLARQLVLAGGRVDGKEVSWINEILWAGSRFDDFASSGDARYATLDIKLHMAVTAVIKEGNRTLATKVSSLEDAALTKGTILKGRQLVWLVHDSFKLNPDMKPVYGLQEITDLKWFGDERVFDFLELWRQIVENNTIELSRRLG